MPLQSFKLECFLLSAKPLNITKRIHLFTMITMVMKKHVSLSFNQMLSKKVDNLGQSAQLTFNFQVIRICLRS